MKNDFEGRFRNYGLVESIWLSNVWDNRKVQLTFLGIAFVLGLDLVRFFLCSHCRDNRMSMAQEGVEGMRSNEAAASCKKNSCHGRWIVREVPVGSESSSVSKDAWAGDGICTLCLIIPPSAGYFSGNCLFRRMSTGLDYRYLIRKIIVMSVIAASYAHDVTSR